jgi:hypothetical protein
MTIKTIFLEEHEDGSVCVLFKPEQLIIVCDDWDQAFECASGGIEVTHCNDEGNDQ